MNPDDFEKQLQRQALQPPPAAWREQILQAARSSVPVASPSAAKCFSLATWWRELILPARYAWGALVAVWIVIAAVSLATRENTPLVAKAAPATHPVERALQAQQQLRAELIGQFEPSDVDRPKAIRISPRSERRIESAVV